MPNEAPLKMEACPDLRPFRDALRKAGYTQAALVDVVRPLGPKERMDASLVRRRAGTDSPFDSLVRFFVLGEALPGEELARALSAGRVEELLALGLFVRENGRIRSVAKLMPFEDWYLIADFGPEVNGEPCRPDHVLGVGHASISLAAFTPRTPVTRALDLGAGAGIQSLFLAQHAERVLGTDTSRRALNFGAFNLRMNDVANVSFGAGSFYEPVGGQTFDLIVSNPPFVISPGSEYEFRDSGLKGDAVCELVAKGAPAHLAEGGYAVALINWHHQTDDDWAERPLQWVHELPCDVWVLCFDTEEPVTYAAKWLRQSERHSDRFESLFDEWTAYYDRLGIGRISAGVLVLRRVSSRPGWKRADRVEGGRRTGSCGSQILRIFEAETLLNGLADDSGLLDFAFRLCDEHLLETRLKVEDAAWVCQAQNLRMTQGLAFSGTLDGHMIAMLEKCDGKRTLRECVDFVAGRLGQDVKAVAPAVLGAVSKLLRAGLLVRADGL
ncbi:MAG: methyltransferase [Kiritimatiellae bacterium]|nr:methyltransferase [Kiritimatiellia bacterium]